MLAWALRYLAVAVVIGIGFAVLHGSLWMHPVSAPSAPQPSIADDARDATLASNAWQSVIEAGPQGHFVLEAVVDGVPVTFLLDTGASEIVLTLADARRLGFARRTSSSARPITPPTGTCKGRRCGCASCGSASSASTTSTPR